MRLPLPTDIRNEVDAFLTRAVAAIPAAPVLCVLEVGIGGDADPRGGNFGKFEGRPYLRYDTLDKFAEYKPTIVGDICDSPVGGYDVVVMSQVLEHVFDVAAAVRGCYNALRPGGVLLVDVPWCYPYHAQATFGDYWRISWQGLKRLLEEAGFSDVEVGSSEILTWGVATR